MIANLQRWYMVAGSGPMAAAVFYLCAVILAYRNLPSDVPIHFDFSGVANGWMNRTIWLVLSPIITGTLVSLVFATRPSPYNVTAIMYWCACGLVVGAFLQINRAAQKQRPFHFLPVLAWLLAVPICGLILSIALEHWWKNPS